jgi:hypothetical protein
MPITTKGVSSNPALASGLSWRGVKKYARSKTYPNWINWLTTLSLNIYMVNKGQD